MALGLLLSGSCQPGVESSESRVVAATECAIEIEVVATITGDHANRAGIGLLTEDRILLVSNVDLSVIEVFDRRGRWIRSVGRRGQGPREFMGIMELRQLGGGQIAAVDGRAGRISFLDDDLEVMKTVSVPVLAYPHGAIAMEDGGWLLSGVAADAALIGRAVVEVDSTGAPRRSYRGGTNTQVGGRSTDTPMRLIAYHPSVGVVSMPVTEYAIEIWPDADAQPEVVRPPADWYQWPPVGYGEPRREGPNANAVQGRPPTNAITGIQFDERGRLWILSQVTPEDWKDGLDEVGAILERQKYVDFMLQVYDLRTKASVCEVRLTDDVYFGGFAGPGILKTYDEDSVGNPSIVLQRLSLREP